VFRGFSTFELRSSSKVLLATMLLTDDDSLVGPNELGLAEHTFHRFAEPIGTYVSVTPAPCPASLDAARAKIQGRTLGAFRYRRNRRRSRALSLFRHGNRRRDLRTADYILIDRSQML
jgi:hypothetical protein